jgi:hypothetical protein
MLYGRPQAMRRLLALAIVGFPPLADVLHAALGYALADRAQG